MPSMDTFIRDAKLTMTSEQTDHNPNMDTQDMDHWRCVIRQGKKSMVVYFSKGYGHHGAEPTLAEVLDCLASDASGAEGEGFGEWCREYGYDEDSRKAERTYKTIQTQAKKLKALLGDVDYDQLLWSVERM